MQLKYQLKQLKQKIKNNLKIKELPIDYLPRKGKSKMRSLPDAYKHIRFMLLYSPLFLFFIPGTIMFLFSISMYFANHKYAFSLSIIAGYQLIIFAAFAKIYSITHLKENNRRFEKILKYINIETAGILGILAIIAGFLLLKNSILALTLMVLGVQTIFSAFMLSILGIKEK